MPVYRAMADELIAMVGEDTYRRVAAYLDRRARGGVPLPTPPYADLLLFRPRLCLFVELVVLGGQAPGGVVLVGRGAAPRRTAPR